MTQVALMLCAILMVLTRDTMVFRDVTDSAGIEATHRGIWDESISGRYENGYLAAGQAWGRLR